MLKGIKKVLIDIFNLFYKVIYGYARWVLAVVIVIICAQVFCRNILRTNIRWNQEVALLLTIWMAFLGIAVGAEKNLHIGVELFYDKFPVKIRNVIDVLNRIITLLVGRFLHCLRGPDGAVYHGFQASGNKMAVISYVYYDTGQRRCHYLLYGPGYNGPEEIQENR